MYVSLTYLHIRSISKLLPFQRDVMKIDAQLRNAEGLLEVRYKNRWIMHNYTLTLWESKAHMQKFMRSGAHKESMMHTAEYSDGFGVAGWEAVHLPEWKDALDKIHESGTFRITSG